MKHHIITNDVIDKFQKMVDFNVTKPLHTDCWIWYGQRDKHGYGIVNHYFKRFFAHRLMYQMTYGDLSTSKIIRHTCDNPSCCNPKHLLQGTPKDNVRDAWNRGRMRKGENHPQAKLTVDQVKELRRDRNKGVSYSQLAIKFGIGIKNAWMIANRKHWKHIE